MPNKLPNAVRKKPEELLKRNLKVSRSVVVQYRELEKQLEKQLEKLGVDTKPHYTLSPPLGGIVSNLPKKSDL